MHTAISTISNFFGGCIATFLPQTKTDLSKRELNDELEKCLTGFL